MKVTPIILMAMLCIAPVRAQQQDQSQSKAGDAQPEPAKPAEQAQQPAQKPEQQALVDPSILTGTSARASKIIGAKVYRGGKALGEIKDVLVDLNHATVPAVIISMSGLLGMNEKLVAVPAAMIKVGKEATFTVDLTEDQLKAAPDFDPSKL